MVFRGFSKKARKDFRKNQEYEAQIRAENRARRKADSLGGPEVEDLLPRSKSLPNLSSGKIETMSRRPSGSYDPQGRVSSKQNSRSDALPSGSRPFVILPSVPKPPSRTTSKPGLTSRRPGSRNDSTSSTPGKKIEPSAYPLTQSSRRRTDRIPTEKAPLGDPERTYLQGLKPPTGQESSSRTTRR